MAGSVGVDLKQAALKKVEKNREKYPVEKAMGDKQKIYAVVKT